jgi:hypothetical protein
MAACAYADRAECLAACGCGWCNGTAEATGTLGTAACMTGDASGPLGAPPGCTAWQIAGDALRPCARSDHVWLAVVAVLVIALLAAATVAWCARRGNACNVLSPRMRRVRSREMTFGAYSIQLLGGTVGGPERRGVEDANGQ